MNLNNQEPLSTESQATLDESFAIAGDETYALKADLPAPVEIKDPPLQHGMQHLKSRLIIATTAWNNSFGARNKVNILTTKFMADVWGKIEKAIAADVKTDADNLSEIIWKPVSYLINEVVTSSDGKYENKTFAAVLTSGQYVYLTLKDNNFLLVNTVDENNEEVRVPANKIIMLRETGVTISTENQVVNFDDKEYVCTLAPQGMPRIRYTEKELQERAGLKRKIDKRRKANKAASKQKSKARK